MRTLVRFELEDSISFKKKLLRWAQQYEEAIFLDSNSHLDEYGSFEAALAADSEALLSIDKSGAFKALSEYKSEIKDWLFGYFTYDLKNELEELSSNNFDGLEFDKLYFFQPKRLIFIKGSQVEFHYLKKYSNEISKDYKTILKIEGYSEIQTGTEHPKIKLRIHKDAYLQKVESALRDIQKGRIYEVNLCQEFFAEETIIEPTKVFERLNAISEPPFAAYLRIKEKYALCASPERYLRKIDSKIISQPIKGTAARSTNKVQDVRLKNTLSQDTKERSENIMITDLVRNDLSKSACKGSVEVEELCEVYSYKQVHQMISTIVSEVPEKQDTVQLIKDTFPMGSMTGAPKVAAMQLIENYEETKRGLYSGAIGYFDPMGDFDFNVVIRTILYNSLKKYVSYSVGSAITSKSVPLKEYQECLLKAKAMRSVLEQK